MIYKILLTAHLVASLVWVGAVFMGSFIDFYAAKESVKEGAFPFRFIIGQGKRVFYSVYFGIFVLCTTGIGLTIHHPPQTRTEIFMLVVKMSALFLMTAFTLYGTFFTWPKIQLSTSEEAYELYKYYNYRAHAVFVLGIIASILGLWIY